MAKATYEGIRDGGMSDDSVCRGLHMASRDLRKKYLSVFVSRKIRQGMMDQVRDVCSTMDTEEERALKWDIILYKDNNNILCY